MIFTSNSIYLNGAFVLQDRVGAGHGGREEEDGQEPQRDPLERTTAIKKLTKRIEYTNGDRPSTRRRAEETYFTKKLYTEKML